MTNDNPPVDHIVVEDEPREESGMERNLKSKSTWIRLVFMFVFYVLASIAGMVATAVVILGFLWMLFTGEANRHLQRAGNGIAAYLYQIVQYLTYNSEQRPFPFDLDWPSGKHEADETESTE